MSDLVDFPARATRPAEQRTCEDVAEKFREMGVSVAAWARVNGFNPSLVYRILGGRQKCLRGQSHQIAVLLGLRHGKLGDINRLQKDFLDWHMQSSDHQSPSVSASEEVPMTSEIT